MIQNKKISYLIILLFALIYISCSGNEGRNNNGVYFIEAIDTSFFVKYNSIFVSDNNGKRWVLSEKNPVEARGFVLLNEYKKIEKNTSVKLDLIKIDTLKLIESNIHFRSHRTGGFIYSFNDLVVWNSDTIISDVYFSPQLYGLYIRSNK